MILCAAPKRLFSAYVVRLSVSDRKLSFETVFEEHKDVIIEHKGSEPIFDYTRLTKLRSALQDDLLDVMAGIPAEAERALRRIKSAVVDEDWEAARAAGHNLRGMAINFGAVRLAEVARRISLTSPETETVTDHIASLESAVGDTCARLKTISWTQR